MKAKGLFWLLLLMMAVLSRLHAQAKNEIGLVMGATVTPSQTLPVGSSTGVTFKPSLALGAEYDRRLHTHGRAAILAGVGFLASPFDVKLDNPPPT